MRILKIVGTIFLTLAALVSAVIAAQFLKSRRRLKRAARRLTPEVATVNMKGRRYRDLNNNGRMDVYEDSSRPIAERVEDLLRPDDAWKRKRA